jgi:hypothetical protein
MDSKPNQVSRIKVLLGAGVLLLAVLAVVLWKAAVPTPPAETKETSAPKKEEPVKPAKVVYRSILGQLGWYTANAEVLGKQITGFYQKADIKPIDNAIAMILPHAGYRFFLRSNCSSRT